MFLSSPTGQATLRILRQEEGEEVEIDFTKKFGQLMILNKIL